jgi:hypothetical protein
MEMLTGLRVSLCDLSTEPCFHWLGDGRSIEFAYVDAVQQAAIDERYFVYEYSPSQR